MTGVVARFVTYVAVLSFGTAWIAVADTLIADVVVEPYVPYGAHALSDKIWVWVHHRPLLAVLGVLMNIVLLAAIITYCDSPDVRETKR